LLILLVESSWRKKLPPKQDEAESKNSKTKFLVPTSEVGMVGIATNKKRAVDIQQRDCKSCPSLHVSCSWFGEGHNLRDGFGFMIPNEFQFFSFF